MRPLPSSTSYDSTTAIPTGGRFFWHPSSREAPKHRRRGSMSWRHPTGVTRYEGGTLIPKKGSRALTLDGSRYRWLLRRKPTKRHTMGHPFVVAVALETGGGTLLLEVGPHTHNAVSLYGVSVTPSDVSRWVDEARSMGWDPKAPGKFKMVGRGASRAYPRGRRPRERADARSLAASSGVSRLSLRQIGMHRAAYVDDVSLLDLVRDSEIDHVAREIERRVAQGWAREEVESLQPGAYMPLLLLEKVDAWPDIDEPDDPRRVLLDCDCGNLGCWPLTASVFVFDERVVWCDFEQLNRDWILDVGPFVFDRDQYVSVLHQ